LNSAQHSIVNGIADRGMSGAAQGAFYQTQATYRNPHTPGYIYKQISLLKDTQLNQKVFYIPTEVV
jgi:hypothetical protein